ncbi:CcmD family protein [Arachidicoccus ginsenosidivorans]|uniref:CcmD family protein n=2 Tax=Arachidicoccus ginsenosidivorans TaxID=496057 RepID=A0A5B8VTR7_9BACT|nr:CcmD family protein [Arachidicoccus ginsenosidivorans]
MTGVLFAQTTAAGAGSEDFMDSNGKIYVVVAVIVLIVIALFAYLFYLDRKIARMEKEHDQQ